MSLVGKRSRQTLDASRSVRKSKQPRLLQSSLTDHFGPAREGTALRSCSTNRPALHQSELTCGTSPLDSRGRLGATDNTQPLSTTHTGNPTSESPLQQVAAPVEWWRCQDPVIGSVRYVDSLHRPEPIRRSQLTSLGPFELIPRLLSKCLADNLLSELLTSSESWYQGSWWFAGQQQVAPRKSAYYKLENNGTNTLLVESEDQYHTRHSSPVDQSVPSSPAGTADTLGLNPSAPQRYISAEETPYDRGTVEQGKACTSEGTHMPALVSKAQHNDNSQQGPASNPVSGDDRPHRIGTALTVLPASPLLQQAAALVTQAVNERLAAHTKDSAGAATATLASAVDAHQVGQLSNTASSWSCSFALANHYADGQQCVGTHSDRLTVLGPLPTIASLTLGASRVFRVRPANASANLQATKQPIPSSTSSSHQQHQSGSRCISSIDIRLEHNMLLIMWPPCQEEWRHEVGA